MKKEPINRSGVSAFAEGVNQHMAERRKLDLSEVYNQLKDRYPLLLTNAYALDNGTKDFDEDYQILRGESSVGKFLLYDNGLDIIFDVDKADGAYIHWHPIDIVEAVKDVTLFMEGICEY